VTDNEANRVQRVRNAAPLPFNSRYVGDARDEETPLPFFVAPPAPIPRRTFPIWSALILLVIVFGISLTGLAIYVGLTITDPNNRIVANVTQPAQQATQPLQVVQSTQMPQVVQPTIPPLEAEPPRPTAYSVPPLRSDMDWDICPDLSGLPSEILGYVHDTGNINMRSGPGINHTVIAGMGAGARLCLRGRTDDLSWGMVNWGKWVAMSNINLSVESRRNFSRLPITTP